MTDETPLPLTPTDDWPPKMAAVDGAPPDRAGDPVVPEAPAVSEPPATVDGPAEGEVVRAGEPTELADEDEELWAQFDVLHDALAAIEKQLAESNARASHREKIIDRLHEENQELKAGAQRSLLEPVITDLLRFHQLLSGEAQRVAGLERGPDSSAGVLGALVDEIELILDRCGVERAEAATGDRFRAGEHRVASVVETTDDDAPGTVAEVLNHGFVDRISGRHRVPSSVSVYRAAAGVDPVDPAAAEPDPIEPPTAAASPAADD